jgi:hypothetical protein
LGHSPRNTLKTKFVEPTIGLEPMNLFLTKEVLYLLSYVGPDFLTFTASGLYTKNLALVPQPRQNLNGGEGRIRTSEGVAGRFTVCSLWPLGNLTKLYNQGSPPLN